MDLLQLIRNRMTDEDIRLLSDIYEPTVVAVPDEDAWHGLTVMPDGKIRFYGHYRKKSVFDNDCDRCYIESTDGGLSWKRHIDDKRRLGPSVYVPFLNKYMNVITEDSGTFAIFADAPDSTDVHRVLITPTVYIEPKFPFVMKSRQRILVVIHERRTELHPTAFFPVVLCSDDGEIWHEVHIAPAPFYENTDPSEGMRWQQNNRENTIEELADGRLMMLSRTATDYHYVCYSSDGGDSWTDPLPSTFHGTGTMPLLKKLSDGRMLFLWCNTRPLPELPEADGIWEDVFTNRDANHAAISEDDGKSWIGFREMALNPLRCNSDFRSIGGPEDGRDKSVHQFEALELPLGKILVVYGQHEICRRMIIFDIKWLYEKGRIENFLHGLDRLSTHLYVKSILGGCRGKQHNPNDYVGHCAYNRTHGAMLIPSPESEGHEVLHICRTNDPRLVSNTGGAVWNFPTATRGTVTVRARVDGEPLRISLLDQWVNPCDPTVGDVAFLSFEVTKEMTSDEFCNINIEFDCYRQAATIRIGDSGEITLPLLGAMPNGICYLHLQSAADDTDPGGALIAGMSFKA